MKEKNVARLASLDQFRGLAILGMVFINYLSGLENAPALLKHSPDIGLTAADLVAPLFIFAIGLTYRQSYFRRAERDGARAAILHVIQRCLLLIGIGSLFSAGEALFGFSTSATRWGVLETIGVAGLLGLLTLRLPWWGLLASGAGVLVIYQVILDNFLLTQVLTSAHGGLFGSLSWTGMLLIAMGLAELFNRRNAHPFYFPLGAGATLFLGIVAAALVPVSKNRVSLSYVLLSLGFAALLYYWFHLLADRFEIRIPPLEMWGQFPLTLYVAHLVGIALFAIWGIPFLYAKAGVVVILLELSLLIGGLTLLAYELHNRKADLFNLINP